MPEQIPIVIMDVSYGFFSVARYAGGCTVYGKEYYYIEPHDALVQKKYVKEIKKHGTWQGFP
jgi:hypothetical protein